MLRASSVQPIAGKEEKKVVVKNESDDGNTIQARLLALGARPRAKSAPPRPLGLAGKVVSSTSTRLKTLLVNRPPIFRRPATPVRRRMVTPSPSPAPSSVCTQTTSGLRLESVTPCPSPRLRPQPRLISNTPLGQDASQRLESPLEEEEDDISIIGVSRSAEKPPPAKHEYILKLISPDCWDISVNLSAPLITSKRVTGAKIQRRLQRAAQGIVQEICNDC